MIPDPTIHLSHHARVQMEERGADERVAGGRFGTLSRCFLSATPAATQALAAALAPHLPPGCLLRLEGDLGAGKTTWVQGLARGLGVVGPVQSPTFTLIREYAGAGTVGLAHMDFYRLAGALQAEDLGLDAYLDGDDVLAVEWPEQAGDALPRTGMAIALAPVAAGGVRSEGSGAAIASVQALADDPLVEQPPLIRLTGLDEACASVLAVLVPPTDPGLYEISCPKAAVDHD